MPLLGISFFIIWALFVNKFLYCHKFDHDEFAFMHVIWSVWSGRLIYHDLWMMNSPGYFYFASFFWKLFSLGRDAETFFYFRYLSFVAMSLILLTTFAIGCRLKNSFYGLISVLFLALNTVFILKGIEIRPDPWQVLLYLIGIYLLMDVDNDRVKNILIGFLWGLSILFNFKAIFMIGITIICLPLLKNKSFKKESLILLGILVSFLLFGLFLLYKNVWYDFIIQTYYTYLAVIQADAYYSGIQQYFIGLARDNFILVVFYCLGSYALIKSKSSNNNLFYFWMISALFFLGSIFLGWFYQWYLQVLPLASLVAAFGFLWLFDKLKQKPTFPVYILLVVLVVAIFYGYSSDSLLKRAVDEKKRLSQQVAIINYVSENIPVNTKYFMFWNDIGGYSFLPALVHAWQIPTPNIFAIFSKYGHLYRQPYSYPVDYWDNYFPKILENSDCGLIISSKEQLLLFSKDIAKYIFFNYQEVYAGVWVYKKHLMRQY